MVNAMVKRATSSMLSGPDWAINIEISDICNHDHNQAKDVISGIKKRLGSKKPKVQLLALTLLEAIVKNGGDIVHMHVAEKDLPREMVKIMRKRPDFHIKEKILTLIGTWQEFFGGSVARYPQFFVAYQDLLHLGEVFPQRSEKLAPNFALRQTHPLTSYSESPCNPKSGSDASIEAEFPTLSLTEIQNARGALDVLTEMLNAITPDNKEGVKQEVIVDLVEQCRIYKQRVVHFVNSSSDESLLHQGLALNDDLQCVLAKHERFVSGASQLEKSKLKVAESLVSVDTPLIDTGDVKQSDKRSASNTSSGAHSLLLASSVPNGGSTTPIKVDPMIDLLSGDDFSSPTSKSLALVPVGEPQPANSVESQQNPLALVDILSSSNNSQSINSIGQAYASSPQIQQQPDFQSPQPLSPPNLCVSGPLASQHDQPLYAHQEPLSPVHGAPQSSDTLPPPPWETELDNSESVVTTIDNPTTPSNQMANTYLQYGQMGCMYPHQMYGNQMVPYGYDYAQGQQQNAEFLEQSMSGLYVRDDSAPINTSYSSNPSYVPFGNASKPEDKLFRDLVKDITKLKPTKRGGSM